MDNEKMLFEKGCFLPQWQEFQPEKREISQAYEPVTKDLNTLLSELNEIEKHIQDVREREWNLAKLMHYHNNGFATE